MAIKTPSEAYLGSTAIFKIMGVPKTGFLGQLDSFVLNSQNLPLISTYFYSFEQGDLNVGDYVLGEISQIDFKKKKFGFTFGDSRNRIKGCVLKRCTTCDEGYFLLNQRSFVCRNCGAQQTFNCSIHYGSDLS